MNKRYIAGINTIQVALEKNVKITNVWIDKNKKTKRIAKLVDILSNKKKSFEHVDKLSLDLLVPNVKHQGVIAEIEESKLDHDDLDIILSKPSPFILIIDGVQDPHNLGACLRSAAAAGIDAVIIPKNRSATVNATVSKVAAGASEILPVFSVNNLNRTLEKIQSKQHWSVALSGHAEQSIYEMDLSGISVVIMGGEEKGVSQSLLQKSDYVGRIPMQKETESLNVSVATGVALFEVVRQKKLSNNC